MPKPIYDLTKKIMQIFSNLCGNCRNQRDISDVACLAHTILNDEVEKEERVKAMQELIIDKVDVKV